MFIIILEALTVPIIDTVRADRDTTIKGAEKPNGKKYAKKPT